MEEGSGSNKVCKKMHRLVFDAGENIDLRQVMKDMYENFTLIFKATISQLENLKIKFHIHCDHDEYLKLRKALGFLITISRCLLKWCVVDRQVDGRTIDRVLVQVLTQVESNFVDLLESCTTIFSCEEFGVKQQEMFFKGESRRHDTHIVIIIIWRIQCVFQNKESSPSKTTCYIHSHQSMVEYLDQILEDLNACDQMEEDETTIKSVLFEKLEFSRNYLNELITKDWMSPQVLKEFLICVEVVADRAAYFSFMVKHERNEYLQIKNRVDSEMGLALRKALVLTLQDSTEKDLPPMTDGLLKDCVDCVREYLIKLVEDEAIDLTTKTQLKNLHKELEFLVDLICSYPPKHDDELEKSSDIRTRFQTLVGNAGSVVLCLNKEETINLTLRISDLHEKANLLTQHIRDIFLLRTFGRIRRNSPKTNQLGFLNFLVDNLRELKDNLTSGGFQTIHKDLVSLRSFLQNTADDDDESKDLSNRIRCAAYEAEYLINSYVAGACPDWCRSHWVSDFKEQMKIIMKATIADISKRKANDIDNIKVGSSKNPSRVRSLPLVPTIDVVVGFEDEMELIKERLTSDLRKLDVISIVGMPGLGKTTLTKKVYEDPSIVDHFQIRAWCCVSQEYDKKELLLTILGSITKLTSDVHRKSFGDLSVMLHRQLMGRRYLIVMDDIWGMDALTDLKRFFPDCSNGSRIILTSRIRLEDYNDPLELRLLTHDESWDLFKQKVYHKEEQECPSELCQVGKKIAEKCRGLPLAIVVVAGILAKSEKKHDFWEQVAGNLSMYIGGDTSEGQVMATLELSYDLLPDHLKPLFLYLGAFPEDTEIPVNKLTWLWIAEGFVHKTDDKLTISLEIQAELNLMDLIDRSLLMVAERRSDGRVKSCRVHDLMRDMCLTKAKEENFMQQMNVHDEYSLYPVTYERRLSISLNRRKQDDSPLTPPTPFVTCGGLPMLSIPPPLSSFLFFNMNKTLPMSSSEVKKSVFCDFRLLRILHSESITVDENSYRDVVMLVHLRYISIRTSWNIIPPSISKLWNLETLIIRGFRGEIEVPKEIWEMVKLRHLHINDRADFSGALLNESSTKLENLETLSTPAVCYEEEKKLIRRVSNLRKLRFILVEARNFYRNYYQLPQLESLNQLESLKMLCYGRMPHSGQFGLPSTLKKLTLSKFRLQWSEVSSFQKLPNLEVLKLRGGAVDGALWDTGDYSEFPKLKFLKLDSLNIRQWINVSAENFPCLKKLVFQSCKQLEEIPSSIGDFYSLEKIEVVWCSTSAAKSAKLIQEEQIDAGNELLKVQIYMSS